jgi:membrane protein implicated in regulation of membrane protease activity
MGWWLQGVIVFVVVFLFTLGYSRWRKRHAQTSGG